MYCRALAILTVFLTRNTAAVYQGFNYANNFSDSSPKTQNDFYNEFMRAKTLTASNDDFTSARLYTMIQSGTTSSPISAIAAAIQTKTSLLLGLWASAGNTSFAYELNALNQAILQYGQEFADLVVGISVGSEDLYRSSPVGIQKNSGPGADPDTLANFIGRTRDALAGTALEHISVGHVDTWSAWVNQSNSAVIDASDFIGMDAYPYFQGQDQNAIDEAKSLFFSAYEATKEVAKDKPIWITETGWPVSGETINLAVPSPYNAQIYWDEVACGILGNFNTWWYILQDADPVTPDPSFGIVGASLAGPPLYNLTCPAHADATVSASSISPSKSPGTTAAQLPSVPTTDAPAEPITTVPPIPQTFATTNSPNAITILSEALTTFPIAIQESVEHMTWSEFGRRRKD